MLKTIFSLSVLLFLCCQNAALGQGFTTHEPPQIKIERNGSDYIFSLSDRPPLRQSLKTKPYFRYFWEFGDGHYSRDESPHHQFAKGCDYEIRLHLVPCGTVDFVRAASSQRLVVPKAAVGTPTESRNYPNEIVSLTTSYNVRADERVVIAVGVKSPTGGVATGQNRLFLFFHDKELSRNSNMLRIAETRTALFGAAAVLTAPELNHAAVRAADEQFATKLILNIPTLDPSVSNVFFEFQKVDASALGLTDEKKTMRVRAILFVNGQPHEQNVAVQIEKSHDPNDLRVMPSYMSFRNIGEKSFLYRARFENTGDNDEKHLSVKVSRSKYTDPKRDSIVDMKPKCPICPDNYVERAGDAPCLKVIRTLDSLEFKFYNISLLGKRQQGIRSKKDAEGFIEYRLFPLPKGMIKTDFSARADVFFSGYSLPTNRARVTFSPGLSIGPKVGVNFDPKSNAISYFVGVTASPYKPEGIYLQFEVFGDVSSLSRSEYYVRDSVRTIIKDIQTQCVGCTVDSVTIFRGSVTQNTLSIIPLQLRIDVEKIFSFGIGGSVDMLFRSLTGIQTTSVQVTTLNGYKYNQDGLNDKLNNSKETLYKFNAFADASVGYDQFRLGARYIFPINSKSDNRHEYWQFYATYKF